MPKIIPISDLRNYSTVLENCDENNEVFLTKNGRGRYVLMDITMYEKKQSELELMLALMEGENSIKNENDWVLIDDVRKSFGV